MDFTADKVVGDAATALQISVAADQPPVAHLGFLGLGVEQITREDVVTGSLESINLGMAGAHAAGDIVARADAAITAGCDMVLTCNDPTAADDLLGRWRAPVLPDLARRTAAMEGR